MSRGQMNSATTQVLAGAALLAAVSAEPSSRHIGHKKSRTYTTKQYARIKRRRKLSQAAKRRNRR